MSCIVCCTDAPPCESAIISAPVSGAPTGNWENLKLAIVAP